MSTKERCFVIMPFSTPAAYDDKEHFSKIYEQVFVPAIKKAGYEPYRVDQDKISDSVVGKIFEAVRKCPMALCDLSSRNPNVLYELGLRQAYNLPVVLVQDDVTDRIFDVSGISTVMYKSHRLVENVEEAIENIYEAIQQTKEGQNRTLASIVKAQNADYDSITVDEDDRIHILLKALADDIKEIKSYQNRTYVNLNEAEEISSKSHLVKLKSGITNKEIQDVMKDFKGVVDGYSVGKDTMIISFNKYLLEKDIKIMLDMIKRRIGHKEEM